MALPASAALTWVGGVNAGLFAEANWLDDNGLVPTGGQINGNTVVTAATGGEIVIQGGGAFNPTGFSPNFYIGTNNLTLINNAILQQNTNLGGIVATAASGVTGTVSGGSLINVVFIHNMDFTVSGGSTIEIYGGGNAEALNSTFNFTDDLSALQLTRRTTTNFVNYYINGAGSSIFQYQGSDLVFGADPFVLETGDTAVLSAFNGTAGSQVDFVEAAAGDSFATWATGGETFEGDANGDGVQDGLAFLLGAATPATDATSLLPTETEVAGGLVLTFDCLPTADRGTSTLGVEQSSDLGVLDAWAASAEVPDADLGTPTNGVTFVVVPGTPLNSVTATIASGEAVDGTLFGRLIATE